MLTRRIIACLDVREGRVVKGVEFRNHVDMGDILELSQRYADEGVDELVFYDITASSDGRVVDKSWVNRIARRINIPFCVAGGIRSIDDARAILNGGADKISVNSPALERPEFISELAAAFVNARASRLRDADRRLAGAGARALLVPGSEAKPWNVWRKQARIETGSASSAGGVSHGKTSTEPPDGAAAGPE